MTTAEIARNRLAAGPVNPAFAAMLKRERLAQPMSVQQAKNARREAEYVAKRNGVKEALLQLWRV